MSDSPETGAIGSGNSGGNVRLLLEVGAKTVTLAAGAAYFLGLVVTTFHLQRYGASFTGFFALQYVTAGVWAIYPIVVGASIAFVLSGPIQWSEHRIGLLRRVGNLGRVVALLFFTYAIGFTPLLVLDVPVLTFRGFVPWFLVFAFVIAITWPRPLLKSSSEPDLSKRPFLGILLMGTILLGGVLIYCRTLAAAYETIPARWGGGAASDVHLVVSEALGKKLRDSYGFTVDSAGVRARLLLLTDQSVLAVPQAESQHPVLLKRDDVTLMGLDAGTIAPTK